MAINQTEIDTAYDAMMTKHKEQLDAQFDANRIDSDIYGKALISLMQQTMQMAITTVQQQPVLDAQVAKTQADTDFVGTQESELTNSVTYNNKIKALDSYGDMLGTMGAGSIVATSDMWTSFFNMVGDLNSSMGTNPANTVVTKLT